MNFPKAVTVFFRHLEFMTFPGQPFWKTIENSFNVIANEVT